LLEQQILFAFMILDHWQSLGSIRLNSPAKSCQDRKMMENKVQTPFLNGKSSERIEIAIFLKLQAVTPKKATGKSVSDQATTTSVLNKMHLSGSEIAQTLMGPAKVVEIEIVSQM
jgi:hypothetical protein